MINTTNNESIYNLDLKMTQEKEHSNNLYNKNHPKWDPADPD